MYDFSLIERLARAAERYGYSLAMLAVLLFGVTGWLVGSCFGANFALVGTVLGGFGIPWACRRAILGMADSLFAWFERRGN